MSERGEGFTVVIGGGGAMAIGISAGIMAALAEAGLDAHDATTAIGTSAGSTVAADLRLGRSFEDIAAQICSDTDGDEAVASRPAWQSRPELARRAIGSSWVLMRSVTRAALPEPPQFVQRIFPGSLLNLGEQQDWAAERYPQAWPEGRVWAVAANLDTGRRVILEADPPDGRPRANLQEALQASCAIPGLYPPVRVDGARLVDGGIRSATNADIAAKLPQRAVVVIDAIAADPRDPPVGPARLLRLWPNRQVLGEIATLRRLGHEVLLLRPGRLSLELAGMTLFSGRITSDVVEATYEAAARRIAEPDLRERLDRILASAGRGRSSTASGEVEGGGVRPTSARPSPTRTSRADPANHRNR